MRYPTVLVFHLSSLVTWLDVTVFPCCLHAQVYFPGKSRNKVNVGETWQAPSSCNTHCWGNRAWKSRHFPNSSEDPHIDTQNYMESIQSLVFYTEIKIIFALMLSLYGVLWVLSCMHLKMIFLMQDTHPKMREIILCLYVVQTHSISPSDHPVCHSLCWKGGKWAVSQKPWTGKKFKETFYWGFGT